MKSVNIEGLSDPIQVRTNSRLIDALLQAETKVLMACGGKGLCATCHIHTDSRQGELSSPTPREKRSLMMLSDTGPGSRLACQAKVLMDGVTLSRPGGQYIESAEDLEGLIGRRAEESILHPSDGRILIEAGKIITRSRVKQLASVSVDVAELRAASSTAVLEE